MGVTFLDRQASSLKAERNRRNLTQEQLASRIGTSKDSITKYERGEVVMSFETAYKIASELSCTLDDLCRA